ncbi:MAG: hypothetical protein LBG22_04990 [Treponema sp.]|jgi:hypothetical protein|nr:hypothetical protein [Treponema sp.]
MRQINTPKNLITTFMAVLCITIYSAALVYGAIRIAGSFQDRRNLMEIELRDLEDLASSAGVLGFMDEPFIQTIEDAVLSSKTMEALIISGPNGEYAFERRQGTVINWVNDSPRFKSSFILKTSDLRPLRIEGQRNVNIQALFGLIDYDFLLSSMKQTLLAVLGGLVLAFLTLLFSSLSGASAVPAVRGENKVDTSQPRQEGAPSLREGSPSRRDGDAETDGLIDFESLVGTETRGGTGKAGVKTPPPEETEEEPADQAAEESFKEDYEEKTPQGLYSARGIGWEEYTRDRLAAELHRCASFEQDLVYIMMEFRNDNSLDEDFFRQFAGVAVEFYNLRDLIFELGEWGISIIYPNIDLDQGFVKSEEFHNRILTRFAGAFRSNNDLCIGISSRAGRLIDAERLIFEAREAMRRAMDDPVTHIVAFKSDPEKYRNFIASQSKQLP